jgi:nitronate monooxygenase
VLTGRPARAIATQAPIPLRTNAEKQGSSDFSSFWSSEARSLGRDMNAEDLTRTIAEGSLALLRSLSAPKKK